MSFFKETPRSTHASIGIEGDPTQMMVLGFLFELAPLSLSDPELEAENDRSSFEIEFNDLALGPVNLRRDEQVAWVLKDDPPMGTSYFLGEHHLIELKRLELEWDKANTCFSGVAQISFSSPSPATEEGEEVELSFSFTCPIERNSASRQRHAIHVPGVGTLDPIRETAWEGTMDFWGRRIGVYLSSTESCVEAATRSLAEIAEGLTFNQSEMRKALDECMFKIEMFMERAGVDPSAIEWDSFYPIGVMVSAGDVKPTTKQKLELTYDGFPGRIFASKLESGAYDWDWHASRTTR